nr:DUF202 domain-containing protein [uncultured Sphingomonas sp.]
MIKNYNDHAANERTFLAWVRTAMAVVGFGLAAARLGGSHENLLTELALVIVGGLVMVLAYLRMQVIKKRIDAAEAEPDDPTMGDRLMLMLIGSFFALMAIFVVHIA